MALDYETLEAMRKGHPAWRLLCAGHAPLIASFLHRVFIVPNARSLSQLDLAEELEDELYVLRERLGQEAFPNSAQSYLNEWAENDKGWLRKYYPQGSDDPHFDLTPATEKALRWLDSLTERSFVGTESRLLMLFDLLRQMSEGTETDAEERIKKLQAERDRIDREIIQITAGEISVLDDTAVRDRFQQFQHLSRDLLSDFREVEDNFRALDRKVREKIALWDGSKGGLLDDVLGERDEISSSDQGRNFNAFWDFLMNPARKDELSELLTRVMALPAVAETRPDAKLKRIHHEWLEAGDHTQEMVARLSEQLRRFLDDQAWVENQRIMALLKGIESGAMRIKDSVPRANDFMFLDDTAASEIKLPLERPLDQLVESVGLEVVTLEEANVDEDFSALYNQVVVDLQQLRINVQQELQQQSQVSLAEVVSRHPLQHGLAELIGYLQIASDDGHMTIDETVREQVAWEVRHDSLQSKKYEVGSKTYESDVIRRATLSRVIYVRK